MNRNILITSAGKRVALVKAFKETLRKLLPDAKVYITDLNPRLAPVSYVADGWFKVERVTHPSYPDQLKKICQDYGIGLVIPTIDTELLLLSKLKNDFRKLGVNVIVGDTQFVETCRDKRNTGVFFENHGIRVPAALDPQKPHFPMFAKPYDGSLSANLHIIKSASDLTENILNDPKLLFMEYIDKTIYKEYTVDMYYGQDNLVKEIVPRERIEIRAGEINKGITRKDEVVGALKEKLGYLPGCIGCICVQLFYNPSDGDIVGIEINPRFGGGYPLSYAAGANYPEYLIREYLLNESIEYTEDWVDEMLMLRYDDAIFTK